MRQWVFYTTLLAMGQPRDDAIVETAARKITSWMEFGVNEAAMSHLHLQHTALQRISKLRFRRERKLDEAAACQQKRKPLFLLFVCFFFPSLLI